MKFPESKLFRRYVDGFQYGLEIGGSAHNEYKGPGKINVDISADMFTVYKIEEEKLCGEKLPVDVVAPAWRLPFIDGSMDYVVASHVLEHCFDLIGTVKEWIRVIRKNGILFVVFPCKSRTFDKDREQTTLQELIDRHDGKINIDEPFDRHWTVWEPEDGLECFKWMKLNVIDYLNVDDVCGNGFSLVIKKN